MHKPRSATTAISAILLAATSISIFSNFYFSALSAVAEEDSEDFKVIPGIRLGVAKIGMSKGEILKAVGKHDGTYTLPTGEYVEYSEWKDPKKNTTIRIFYNRQGKVTQVSTDAPLATTTDGISVNSQLSDLSNKYKNLKMSKYRAKDGRIEYYDDIKRGISFEFTHAENVPADGKHMYAIIVHTPGRAVLPDADERPTNK